MEEFSLDARVGEQDAKEDKITLTIGPWYVRATALQMSKFVVWLTDPCRSHSTHNHIAYQKVSSSSADTVYWNLKILHPKQGRGYKESAPLFTGSLSIKHGKDGLYLFVLKLNINPTRFCVYQEGFVRSREDRKHRLSNRIVLFAKQNVNQCKASDEATLDGADNCLLSSLARNHGSLRLYRENFVRYIKSITDYLERDIYDFQSPDFQLAGKNISYSVQSIEIYWEFSSDAPTLHLKSLEFPFKAISHELKTKDYKNNGVGNFELGQDGLTPTYKHYRSKSESIKIYAKTNKRIRFEYEYKFNKTSYAKKKYGATPKSIEELISLIEKLANNSANEINTLIEKLKKYITKEDVHKISAINFIRNIYKYSENVTYAEMILIGIAGNGGISSGTHLKYLVPSLNDLVKRGILCKQEGGKSRYIPSAAYKEAFEGYFVQSKAM
jgi:hypothetical protein